MSNLFNLKTSTNDLSMGNSGISKACYDQVSASRDVAGTNFPNGQISFKFQHGSTKWWIPSKSYIRTRMSITKGDGTPLTSDLNIAPAMNITPCLFQSMEFRINDKTVSKVADFVPQLETLATRQLKSKAWIDSVGRSSNMWINTRSQRAKEISADGAEVGPVDGAVAKAEEEDNDEDDGEGVGGELARDVPDLVSGGGATRDSFETVWSPASLSIFNVDHALPTGNYELVFNPHNLSTYQTLCVETKIPRQPWSQSDAGDFKVSIQSMYLYVYTVEGPRVENMSYLLDLESSRIQTEANLSKSFSQKMFDISPSTYAITVAYQDSRVGSNTTKSATQFNLDGNSELCLNRFYLNYGGVNYPSPDGDYQYTDRVDFTTQLYINTLINNGKFQEEGGAETKNEFNKRGMYITYQTPRDGSDRSTKLTVNAGFDSNATLTNARLLVCDSFREIARVQIKDGRVIDVQLEQA